MSDPVKLKFIDSVHEQREQNNKILPIKGCWVEVGKFEPVIERFHIKERWKCTATGEHGEGDDMTLYADIELLDYDQMIARSEALAEQILEKHGRQMIDSLRIMLVRGLYNRFGVIDEYRKKRIKLSAECAGDQEKKDKARQLLSAEESLELAKKDIIELEKEIQELKGGIQDEQGSKDDLARGAEGQRAELEAN